MSNQISMGLVGYWKLDGNCRDYSGKGNHGMNHGVNLTVEGQNGERSTAGEFNGRDSYIEVKNSQSLNLGTGNFSLSAWIYTKENMDDVIGDVISKYDPCSQKGFNFSVIDNQYRTSSNRRNIFFGIDNAKIGTWTDCGNCAGPDLSVGVFSLCVHKGKLYAGSYTANNGSRTDMNPLGHVYRYEGGTEWTDCGLLGNSSNVLCLASHKGDLYGGVAFAEAGNGFVGKVFRYEENGDKWIDCGQLGRSLRVECMSVFDGKLYCGVFCGFHEETDSIFCYEGNKKWRSCEQNWGFTVSLGIYNGSLYATRGARVHRYEGGTTWIDCERPGGAANIQTWSFAIYHGKLFVGTFPSGRVYRYESGTEWIDCGRLEETPGTTESKEVMALAVYNGKLYGSLWPTGEVYRYDGDSVWTHLGTLGKQGQGSSINWRTDSEGFYISGLPGEKPPRYKKCYQGNPGISRTPTLALYEGKLYAGTWNWEYDLPGHVYCIEAGKSITYDYELDSGWKHLAVVKDTNKLRLYIDGVLKASSSNFSAADYDVSNNEPLKIGFGAHDYFNGKLNQVRIYSRTLSDGEIKMLSEARL